jgi:ABC-type lipoprotein export system ATPase subunit
MSILGIDLHSSKSTIRLSFHFQNVTLMNHLTTSMLCRRIQAREPHVRNIRQLEAALHREWQQLSQQDIRRLTGGMRRRVEAVIQARGGISQGQFLQ